MSLKENYNSTLYLTGLRCFAALAVFFTHAGGLGIRNWRFGGENGGTFFNNFVNFGKFGVVVFFVLSAVTISISIDNTPSFKYKDYLIKRFFRIAPMYYLALIVAFIFGGIEYYFTSFGVKNDLVNLLYHFSFLNLFDSRYRNNLLGVEWTIPLEMFYYLILPPLHFALAKFRWWGPHLLLISFAISLVGYRLLFPLYDPAYWGFTNNWTIEKYLFSYVVGLLLYEYGLKKKSLIFSGGSLILLEMFAVLACFILANIRYEEEFVAMWTVGLILILSSRPKLGRIIFENSVVLFIGNISFSFYLVHYPIITMFRKLGYSNDFFVFFAALLLTILISTLTYYLIERPALVLGRKLL